MRLITDNHDVSGAKCVNQFNNLLINHFLCIHRGFKDNEAGTRESMLEPGWYSTGDIGYLDKNGYLTIVDRLKDVIKYKG